MSPLACLAVVAAAPVADEFRLVGAVIVHSIWQAALVAAALAGILQLVPRSAAWMIKLRYVACLVALAALPLMALATAAGSGGSGGGPGRAEPRLERPRGLAGTLGSVASADRELAAAEPAGVEGESGLLSSVATPQARAIGLRLEPWLPAIGCGWLVGLGAIAVRMTAGWMLARRLVRAAVADGRLARLVDRWRPRLAISRRVRALVSDAIDVPVLIGVVRPVILWPAAAFTGFAPEHIEAILVHELAHVRRHDALVNLLQAAIETLFFHHPAAWWISAQVRAEREHCADDLAVQALGRETRHARLAYATALVLLEERRRAAPALAVASDGGRLLDRVRRLAGVAEPATGAARFAMLLALGLGAAVAATGLVDIGRVAEAADESPAAAGPDLMAVAALDGEAAARIVRLQAAKPAFPGRATPGRGRADVDGALVAAGMTAESVAQLRGLREAKRQSALRHQNEGDVAVLHYALRRQETPEWLAIRNLFGNELFLPAVREVSVPVARELAAFSGDLFLPGLASLSVEAAAAFAEHQGRILGFEGLEALSVAAAEALVPHRGVLIVSVRSGLEPEVVRVLAQKPLLRLENIGSLSAEAAATLVEVRGNRPLSLAGFTAVSPEVAASLAKLRLGELELGGVRELAPEAIAAFGSLACQRINLGGLTSLSVAQAKAISKLTCDEIELSGVTSLPVEVAAELARFTGQRLCLNGLESLPADVAGVLAGLAPASGRNRRGTEIQLCGLSSIDRGALDAFARYRGVLYLGGLTTIDAATAEALARRSVVDLAGLLRLEPDVAAALARQEGQLRLPAVTTLSPAAARALAPHKGTLDLSGLPTLEGETAAALAASPSVLLLNGLSELAPEAARELARRSATVSLLGVSTLSVETARVLVGWQGGNLALYGLKQLDPEAAAVLLAQPKVQFNHALIDRVTPAVVEALVRIPRGRTILLPGVRSFSDRDAVPMARALAALQGRVILPNLGRISPKALAALLEKPDLVIPRIDMIELIAEPDGSPTDDFVVTEEVLARQQLPPGLVAPVGPMVRQADGPRAKVP